MNLFVHIEDGVIKGTYRSRRKIAGLRVFVVNGQPIGQGVEIPVRPIAEAAEHIRTANIRVLPEGSIEKRRNKFGKKLPKR